MNQIWSALQTDCCNPAHLCNQGSAIEQQHSHWKEAPRRTQPATQFGVSCVPALPYKKGHTWASCRKVGMRRTRSKMRSA